VLAQAAGFRLLDIPADHGQPALQGAVWSPCARTPGDVKVGPYVLFVARECPLAGSAYPLVVISHGWGGSYLGHRDIAATLADAGFVVVAINHGDNALSPRRNGDRSVLIERPTDIRRVIDFMLGSWPDAARIDARRVGFFGFSRGGYTGLVAIGANPVFVKTAQLCANSEDPACRQAHEGERLTLAHDPRIKVAVIADPLAEVFAAGSFANVNVPVQLWRSEQGGDGVTPASVAAIARELPTLAEFHTVANAGHFAFLPPCPAGLARQAPEICADPAGFDRAGFHQQLDDAVLAFFRHHL